MAEFPAAPASVFDSNGTLRAGTYEGSLRDVDIAPGLRGWFHTIRHRKRWMYTSIASDELFVSVAVVKLGYAANTFAFGYDPRERRMLFDQSHLLLPHEVRVADTAGEGCDAAASRGARRVRMTRERGSNEYVLSAALGDVSIDARLDASSAPPGMTAIAPLAPELFNVTEKRTLLPARGTCRVGARTFSFDGGVGGFDYTHGLLLRHTVWRWGFGLGRDTDGRRVAFNLTEGFLGRRECVAWSGDSLAQLGTASFSFDPRKTLAPWTISSDDGSIDLRFVPGAEHAEHRNLGIIRSRFVQPVGAFSGTLRVNERTVRLERVLGVVEDQDVVW